MSIFSQCADASTLAEAIAQRCAQARPHGDHWQACCPAHEDHTPSLSITPGPEKVLLKCHAGCTAAEIVAKLDMTMADLFVNRPAQSNGYRRIVRVYDYYNEQGTLVHQTVRYEPKDFRQRRPDPAKPGEDIWNLQEITTVLYHLPAVLAAVHRGETIYLCEGEKDTENVQALGLTATCNPMGAGKGKWKPSYSEVLRGADVVILPHNDAAKPQNPGHHHGQRVARALAEVAAQVTVLQLPGLSEDGGDVSDWLHAGGDRAQLEALTAAAPRWEPEAATMHTPGPPPADPPQAPQPEEGPEGKLPYSDYTNARALVRAHGQDLRYCWPWKKWLVWTGSHWQLDDTGTIRQLAKHTIKRLARHAEHLEDQEAKALLGHVKKSLSTAALKAMIESAQDEPGIPVLPDALDTDPWFLNCTNGTIDLTTGLLQPPQQAHLITKCLPVAYEPDALCPTWHAFLWKIMGGNPTPDDPDMSESDLEARSRADDRPHRLIDFLQRALGYALTGSTSEQCLFILHGTGANGKSTLLELLQTLLDDYAQSTPAASLLAKDRHEGIPNDIARLRGARLVTAVEIGEGKRLNEELVKRLTGGDTLTARFLHAEFFDFVPEFKLFIACNHLPTIKGTDHAIWRRVYRLPFTVTIPPEEQDSTLPARLRAELPGILAWLVQGCLAWQKNGLQPPQEVRDATQEYKTSMDVFEGFLTEECTRLPGISVRASDLYSAYERWCNANDIDAISKRAFGIRLAESGLTAYQGTGGTRFWQGIDLPSTAQEDKRSGT